MPAIKLTGFSGEQPRIIPRLMPDTAAQSAINTRLDDGGLTPVRKTVFEAHADSATCRSIYRHANQWLCWENEVDAAPGPVAQERLYYTGDGPPKMRVGEEVYPLALPRPLAALTATPGGAGAGDVVTRIYVYTWVTSFGEESEPGPVSNAVDWQPGQDVVLSGFAAPPAGRAVTRQRIYRSQTGQSGTYFYFVAERDASTSDFTDTIAADAFQEPLPSAAWNAPPDDLAGLVALPNGMMAAFAGNRLHFCEPYRPHAWPEKYVLTTEYPIVGVRGMANAVLVMTTGLPYMATGTSPDTMQMVKLEHNLPCINARGIVDLGYAVAYPSNEGLVVVKADGSFALATANIFDRDGWMAHSPETMIGAQHMGRYAAFYRAVGESGVTVAGALLIDLSAQAFLIRVDVDATACFFDIGTGGLYFLKRGTTEIRRVDAPNAARALQYWKSKQFVLPYPENFGAVRIDAAGARDAVDEAAYEAERSAAILDNGNAIAAGPIGGALNEVPLNEVAVNGDTLAPMPRLNQSTLSVGIYADRKLVRSIAKANRIERLPAGFKARVWEVDVFGDVAVEQIAVAKTIDELKVVP